MPFVKKTRSIRDPETKQTYEVVEIVIQQAEVKSEIEKKRRIRNRAPKSVGEIAAEAELVRKKRRIRENIRRLKNDNEILGKVMEAIDDHDHKKLFEEAKLVCGRCGMPGHMRTNKICPKYEHREGETSSRVLLAEPVEPPKQSSKVRRAFDYLSSMEHSVAAAAARDGVATWNKWDAELAAVQSRPSARELIANPPQATRVSDATLGAGLDCALTCGARRNAARVAANSSRQRRVAVSADVAHCRCCCCSWSCCR